MNFSLDFETFSLDLNLSIILIGGEREESKQFSFKTPVERYSHHITAFFPEAILVFQLVFKINQQFR